MTSMGADTPGRGSLLDDEALAPPPLPQRGPSARERLSALDAGLRRRLAALWRRRPLRYGGLVLLAGGLGAAAWWWYDSTRFQPPPDYTTASLDTLFNYTLLTDDFNKLPIKERLALIQQLIERLKTMGDNDSVLMAYFASLIAGEARKQLEENVSRLAVDLFDDYAKVYDPRAGEEDRTVFLEGKFIEFQKTMEGLAGVNRDITDEQRLERGRRQAQRDAELVKDGEVPADVMLRMFDVVNNGIGEHADGHQKARISKMMRDMAYTMRRNAPPPPAPAAPPAAPEPAPEPAGAEP